MLNLPNSNSGSFDDLLQRINRHAQDNGFDKQILALLQQTFENELAKESIVLSRPEKVRLYQQFTKSVLTDVLRKIDQ